MKSISGKSQSDFLLHGIIDICANMNYCKVWGHKCFVKIKDGVIKKDYKYVCGYRYLLIFSSRFSHYIKGENNLNGPAYMDYVVGYFEWYKNNKIHREDGPARVIRMHDTDDNVEYYLEGFRYSKKNYCDKIFGK